MLIRASAARLSDALAVLDDLAEVRKPAAPGVLLSLEPPAEQHDWVQDLAGRTTPAGGDAPAVAVLDTGTYREHPLLEASLAAADSHACNSAWGVDDHDGHGTEMAGLALVRQPRRRHRQRRAGQADPPTRVGEDLASAARSDTAESLWGGHRYRRKRGRDPSAGQTACVLARDHR